MFLLTTIFSTVFFFKAVVYCEQSSFVQLLTSNIKSFQARVSSISEKKQQLLLRVAQSSTVPLRKRYLPEVIYKNWTSSMPRSQCDLEVLTSGISCMPHVSVSSCFDSAFENSSALPYSMPIRHSTSVEVESKSLPCKKPNSAFSPLISQPLSTGIAVTDSSRIFHDTLLQSGILGDTSCNYFFDNSVKFTHPTPELKCLFTSCELNNALDTDDANTFTSWRTDVLCSNDNTSWPNLQEQSFFHTLGDFSQHITANGKGYSQSGINAGVRPQTLSSPNIKISVSSPRIKLSCFHSGNVNQQSMFHGDVKKPANTKSELSQEAISCSKSILNDFYEIDNDESCLVGGFQSTAFKILLALFSCSISSSILS